MVTAATHAFGRRVLAAVWAPTLDTQPTTAELQAVAAISCGEGVYGRGRYRLLSIEPGESYGKIISTVNDSNNWGAVQTRDQSPESSFLATDSSPKLKKPANPKGYYNIRFKRHATPEIGAASYLRTLLTGQRATVRAAIRTGSAVAIAEAMHATGYFEGFEATVPERIRGYASRIAANAKEIASALNEPLMITMGVSPIPPGKSEPQSENPTPETPSPQVANSGVGLIAVGGIAAAAFIYVRSRRRHG